MSPSFQPRPRTTELTLCLDVPPSRQVSGEPWGCDVLVETAHLKTLPEAKQGGLLAK